MTLYESTPRHTEHLTTALSEGLPGIPRPQALGTSDGITLTLIVLFILVALSLRSGIRLVSQMLADLFRPRKNDASLTSLTLSETRLRFFMQLLTWILEGIVLAFLIQGVQPRTDGAPAFTGIGAAIGCAAAYYLLQVAVYKLLGSIFSNPVDTARWLSGYISIHSLLGIFLFPVTFIMIYVPSLSQGALGIAVTLYILSRILFIYKSIKIFLRDIYGILYFILYLCALEVIPLILLFRGVVAIYDFLDLKTL
ncbi:MAG: DUF4271 domain-containing protein [Coprobacter sp.]|nr:DUF4271 domain-containing protein [Coprobacter sp.]